MEVFKGTQNLKGYSQATLKQHLSPAWNMEEGPQNQPAWACGGPEMLLCMAASSTLTKKGHVGCLLWKEDLNPFRELLS